MKYAVHLCSFSGTVANLTVKQKKDPLLVLQVLKTDPLVSTWDMGEHKLYRTIYDLIGRGLITDETGNMAFPWHRFPITEEGRKYLEVVR
jgi:hypothetical protein